MKKNPAIENFKIDFQKMLESGKIDVGDISLFFDLAHLVMNLIEMEEHLAFSYSKTGKEEYAMLITKIRKIRAKYLKLINIKMDDNSEAWCLGKHLFSAWYRSYEVFEKLLQIGEVELADEIRKIPLELMEIYVFLKSREGVKKNETCSGSEGRDTSV